MKATRIQAINAFVLTLGGGMIATAALAADPPPASGAREFEGRQVQPAPLQGTHESRQAERKEQRELVKQQAKSGQLPQIGEDWGVDKNPRKKLEGTPASRSAERQEKRAEMKQLVKSGDMPVNSETEVNVVKKP